MELPKMAVVERQFDPQHIEEVFGQMVDSELI